MKRLFLLLPALLCLGATAYAQCTFSDVQNDYYILNCTDVPAAAGNTSLGAAIPGAAHVYYEAVSDDFFLTGVIDPSNITGGDPPMGNYMLSNNASAANNPFTFIHNGTDGNQLVVSQTQTNFEISRIDQFSNNLRLSAGEASVGSGYIEIDPTFLHFEVAPGGWSNMATLNAAKGFHVIGSSTGTSQAFGVESFSGTNFFTVLNSGHAGFLGAPNTSYDVTINGSGTISSAWFVSSDKRYKTDVKPIENALGKVLKLNGMNYKYNREQFPDMNFSDRTEIGFIAQELEKVLPEVVMTDKEGYKAVNYANITALLAEALKEEHQQLEAVKQDMEKQLHERDAQIESLQKQLDEIKAMLTSAPNTEPSHIRQVDIKGGGDASFIGQNMPNPFGSGTAINYFVNAPDAQGQIIITDLSGRNIKTVEVQPGHGTLELNFSDFPAGVLVYSLYVNGQLIGSKQMVRK